MIAVIKIKIKFGAEDRNSNKCEYCARIMLFTGTNHMSSFILLQNGYQENVIEIP